VKLPSFKRIFTADYPKEFKQLVDTLSVSLNNGIEVLYQALNGQLTLTDNLKATVKDVTVTVDSTGKPKQPSVFTLNTGLSKLDGLTVLSAINNTNSGIFPTSGVFISFSQNNSSVIINNITGLQADQSYTLHIVAYAQ
jgi:outer membrane protein assembly factor BamA